MEQLYLHDAYKAGRDTLLEVLGRYAGITNLTDEWLHEALMASYKLCRLIKDNAGFPAERNIAQYTLGQIIRETRYQIEEGHLREEAAALETLSRILYAQIKQEKRINEVLKKAGLDDTLLKENT